MMKKITKLTKTLLVAAGLLVGTSAWAENMTTMTGLLGLTDNSNGFGAYATKVVTIAAGETYQYTFVNYNKGSEGTDLWENWAVEGRRSDNSHCFDFRADGGYWTWKPDADEQVLAASYTGNVSTDVSTTTTDWLTAYNGVTVTLTISRSNDGNTITVAHTATTKNSTTYAGTFTCAGFGTGDATIIVTNEDSHQIIQKVVYTYDGGGTIYTSRMTYISGTDANKDTSYGEVLTATVGYNKISGGKVELGNASWGVNNIVFVQVDASDVPTTDATITSATLNLNAYGTGRPHNIGVGYNSSTWSNTMTWNSADRAITALGSTQSAPNSAKTSLNFNVLSALTAGEATTLLVYDTAAGGCSLSEVEGVINYSTSVLYTVTFTETNSLKPSITVYTDNERTSPIEANVLEANTTYYFTASLEGYVDYLGSFDVETSNPSVNFTMTLKPRYTFTVNAVNSDGGATLKTFYTDDESYDGKKHLVYFPAYLTGADNVVTYSKDNSTYYANYTSESSDATKTVSYTAYTGNALLFEGEDVTGATVYTTSTFAGRSSNGATGVLSEKTVTSLDAGSYKISARVIGKAGNTCSMYLTSKTGEKIFDVKTSTSGAMGVGYITLDATTPIVADGGYYTTSDNGFGFDYILIEKVLPATVTAAGWATLYTPYALDFSGVTGLEAYTAAVSESTVTLTKVNDVPANTGVVLKAAAETYDIPVIASSETAKGDLEGNATAATAFDAFDGYTLYILTKDGDNDAQFNPMTSGSLAAGKAYLKISNATPARSLKVVFADETTGINSINADAKAEGVYNMNGQRVANPAKGLYIVNGKKVIIK